MRVIKAKCQLRWEMIMTLLLANQKVGETQSRVVKNIVNHKGVDKVDGGSSLMNRMKKHS